ncbi:endonuclease/exonuclease/phosphatase family protein [Sphingobium phenoxybenzoativorans]|uniref:endonuclease/exonuclease/phosphatase family protein n=1 Tax=Sphingobium phenoxybenzoativorans TaxID=1592790 RepID=UPI0009F36DA1|nr:endonuclease/exonuclease/phosphatase family protein [Sphingobium phenoxybenzoativorans]
MASNFPSRMFKNIKMETFYYIILSSIIFLTASYTVWPIINIDLGEYERIFAVYPFILFLHIFLLIYGILKGGRWLIAISLGLIGVAASLVVSEMWSAASCEASEQKQISIVSHNLAVRNRRPEATVRALLAANPDVLLLQEASGSVEPYLPMLDRQYPYHSRCVRGCDLRIYSRISMDRVRWRFKDSNGATTGPHIMWTHLTLPTSSILLATVHMARDGSVAERNVERRRLMNFIHASKHGLLIVAGDFNLTPWEFGMREFDRGIIPARRVSRALFSFPSRMNKIEHVLPVLPIDHFVVGSGLSVASVDRLPPTGSDHFPIIARLVVRHDANRPRGTPSVKGTGSCAQ